MAATAQGTFAGACGVLAVCTPAACAHVGQSIRGRHNISARRCVDSAPGFGQTDAVNALKVAQSADKLYKYGDVEQGLIAAANYRIGCEIFVRLVDGANELLCRILTMSHARKTVRLLSAFLSLPSDDNTDEKAKSTIKPKIAQIRGRLSKLEAALAASREEETAAATLIQARVRGTGYCTDNSCAPLPRCNLAPD